MDDNWESATKPTHIMREVLIIPKPGLGMLALSLGALLLGIVLFVAGAAMGNPIPIVLAILCGILGLYGLIGLFTVSPNEAKVLQLFGSYKGTVREPGPLEVGETRSSRSRGISPRDLETSRASGSRLTTWPATRSRSPRWSSGGWSTRPRRSFMWTTTTTSSMSRANRPCGTWH